MNIWNIKVEIIDYALYLLLPLIGYAIIKTLRNGIVWLYRFLFKKSSFGEKVDVVTRKMSEKLSNSPVKKLKEKLPEKISKRLHFRFSVGSLMILVAAVCFMAAFRMQLLGEGTGKWRMFLWMVPFLAYGLFNGYRAYRFRVVSPLMDLCGLAVVLILLELNCTKQNNAEALMSMDTDLPLVLQNSFFMLLSWFGCFLLIELYYIAKGSVWTLYKSKRNKESKNVGRSKDSKQSEDSERGEESKQVAKKLFPRAYMGATISFGLIVTVVLIVVFGVLIERSGLHFDTATREIAREYFTEPVHILNIYILLFACGVLFFAFGKGTGGFLALFLVAFVYIANFIKLEYHNTFFTWFDLLQLKEMLLMGKEFLTPKIVAMIVVSVIVLVALIIIFRKPLGRFLRIRPRFFGVVAAVAVLLFFVNMVYEQQFKPMNIFPRTWENEDVNVEHNGLIVNLVYNLKTFSEIQMEKPVGYSEEMAESVKEKFEAIEVPASEKVQPDVILILAESLFDLDDVQGITLSRDIDATVDAYSAGTLISPRYGGYTSAMEFEALTGLSLAYMPNALTPYTTYFNNPEEEFPCIVREFKNNDYKTMVMHPGLPNFYNRTTVYENFGFDEYLAIDHFAQGSEHMTDNGFYKDVDFGNEIIKQLQEAEEPTFLFGISMEGHFVTVDKYADPLVKASSTVLADNQLNQIEQQATSYYYTDQMIANIIEYMNTTDRPTLLYVYGDHLPPVEEFGTLGFIYDKYGKYSTSLVMFSNYKNISTGTEYITPNQLAAQIMVDSGIEHSSYYDYIYSVREKYPILHKEFALVEGNPELDDYYFLQYDILAGKKYLYEKE